MAPATREPSPGARSSWRPRYGATRTMHRRAEALRRVVSTPSLGGRGLSGRWWRPPVTHSPRRLGARRAPRDRLFRSLPKELARRTGERRFAARSHHGTAHTHAVHAARWRPRLHRAARFVRVATWQRPPTLRRFRSDPVLVDRSPGAAARGMPVGRQRDPVGHDPAARACPDRSAPWISIATQSGSRRGRR
jgi:hypothetical protein